MSKGGCENKYALFILLIFHSKNSQTFHWTYHWSKTTEWGDEINVFLQWMLATIIGNPRIFLWVKYLWNIFPIHIYFFLGHQGTRSMELSNHDLSHMRDTKPNSRNHPLQGVKPKNIVLMCRTRLLSITKYKVAVRKVKALEIPIPTIRVIIMRFQSLT